MKNLISSFGLCCWLGCFLLASHPLFAQQNAASGSAFQLGIKAGLSAASIGGDVSTLGAGKILLGGVASAPVWEIADLKAELLLTGQGALDATRREVNGRWNYVYLNLPILASFMPFDNTDFRLEAGLQPGILVDAWYVDRQNRFNIKSETRKLEFSLVLGGAWQFYPRWILDLRIVSALHNHSLRAWTGDRYFNQGLQVGVTYVLIN